MCRRVGEGDGVGRKVIFHDEGGEMFGKKLFFITRGGKPNIYFIMTRGAWGLDKNCFFSSKTIGKCCLSLCQELL